VSYLYSVCPRLCQSWDKRSTLGLAA
jgi:hypothetical protein